MNKVKSGFGTAPVFLTAISTILGAIMFLRFGYAVGNLSFIGALGIIALGHMVTIPTAAALSEISTNQKVKGGGEYFVISRSFGLSIGATIGIALFLSQAVSVAFYIIALSEAFTPVIGFVETKYDIVIQTRFISYFVLIVFSAVMLTKGASLGMKILYVIVGILFLAILSFFIGSGTGYEVKSFQSVIANQVENPDSFFVVFAIVFPAFTGMTAGVGLSGDLKDPGKSIPWGTMSATVIGLVMYVLIAYKLVISASPEELDANQHIMAEIAIWGPIVYIGLGCATLSSALGSVMVAPRTLQAIARDDIFPIMKINKWLSAGKRISDEPVNASILVSIIGFIIITIGDLNLVARVISMFFMITYGSICLISFMEHFASSPSYRPTFKSRWYISLIGAIMCLFLMFKMSGPYAVSSLIGITVLYLIISYYKKDERGMAAIFSGFIFQLSRSLRIFSQKKSRVKNHDSWRPSVISISRDTFDNSDNFDLTRWIADRYGFATYLHLIEGYLSKETTSEAEEIYRRLVEMGEYTKSNVFLNTLICPSFTTALAQSVQLPGISGQNNNMILFSCARESNDQIKAIVENIPMVKCKEFDIGILMTTSHRFGHKKDIHIWIQESDFKNVNLMILLGYIILGHKDWEKASIKIFVFYPNSEEADQNNEIVNLIESGRLPISPYNIRKVEQLKDKSLKEIINEHSRYTDLTILGFNTGAVKHAETEVFQGYEDLGNILFINASSQIKIT